MVRKMRSVLSVLWLVFCLMKCSSSTPLGISPKMTFALDREDNGAKVVFDLSGLMSLRLPENITKSYPMSAVIELKLSPSEAFDFKKPIVGWNDSVVESIKPAFRKDYTFNEEAQGWFKLHRVPERWEDARDRCELEGAELASPLNKEIYDAMRTILINNGIEEAFTGVHSMFSYGDYYSIKGVSLEEMPVKWSSNTPSANKNHRCVMIWKHDYIIYNVNCSYPLPYICYKNNNYTYNSECGTTDPEYTYYSHLNTCLKLHTEKKSWHNAFKTCSAEGGHLVIVDTAEEMTTVVLLIHPFTPTNSDMEYHVLVGLVKDQDSEQWRTIHDEKLENTGLSLWKPNYQAPYYPASCGALGRSGLIPVSCDQEWYPFVCEKKPDSLIVKPERD